MIKTQSVFDWNEILSDERDYPAAPGPGTSILQADKGSGAVDQIIDLTDEVKFKGLIYVAFDILDRVIGGGEEYELLVETSDDPAFGAGALQSAIVKIDDAVPNQEIPVFVDTHYQYLRAAIVTVGVAAQMKLGRGGVQIYTK